MSSLNLMASFFVLLFGQPQGVVVGLASILVRFVLHIYSVLEHIVPSRQLFQLIFVLGPPLLFLNLPY